MLITNSTFSAKHDLDYKNPLYLVIFENEPGGYCNHMVAGVDAIESLNFDTQTGSFTPTETLTGATSGATATILSVTDDGTTGILYLTDVVGTFQNNEIIYESALGSELVANGNFTSWTGDNPDSWNVYFEDANNYVTEDSGKCRIVSDNSAAIQITQAVLQQSAFYFTSIDVTDVTSGALGLYLCGTAVKTLNSVTTYSLYKQAGTSGTSIAIARSGSCDITIDNVSVKQITNAALANGTTYKTYSASGTALIDKEDGDTLLLEDGSGDGFLIQPGGSLYYKRYLRNIAGLQQRVTPEEGKGTIGGITFDLLDVDNEITNLISTDPYYFHRRKTTIKAGYSGMNEDDLINIMVGWITGIKLSNDGLYYQFSVTDPQKWMQRKIFRGTEDSSVTLSGNALNILLAVLTSTGNGTNGNHDWLAAENSLGIDIRYVDIDGIENVRDDWYPGASAYMSFTIDERIKAKDFIEKEILKPLNLYPVVDGSGRFSVKPFKPPLAATDEVVVIDEDVIIGLPGWDMNLSALVNEVEWHYNYDSVDNEFDAIDFYIDSTSLNNRGPGKAPIVIKCKGFSTLVDLMGRSNSRIFGRFATPPIKITAKCFFSRWLAEAGDIILFSHPNLPDIELGTRGISNKLMEITNRTVDWMRGIVKLELLDTGFDRGAFGVITPTMTITGVTDQENFTVSTADAAKYYGFTLPEVQILDAGMRQKVASVTILSINSETGAVVIDSAGTDLSAGWIVAFADYDNCTDTQQDWGFIADSSDDLGAANDDAHLIVP